MTHKVAVTDVTIVLYGFNKCRPLGRINTFQAESILDSYATFTLTQNALLAAFTKGHTLNSTSTNFKTFMTTPTNN